MLFELLKNYNFSSKFVIADALYSTVKFANFYYSYKRYFHTKVKNQFRKILKKYYEKYNFLYKKRKTKKIFFIKKIANVIKTIRKIEYSLIDATGFGFDESYKLKMLRGKELRKAKSHILD
jgi:hypothetical protein